MPGSMPLQTREGISSSAAPEPQPRAPRSRALLGRVFLGLCFFGIYLLLTRSDIILQARSGFSVWYPANGLAFAFMLGISPWYAPLAAVADFLSAVLFYHERMLSWTVALGPVGTIVYATAAIILRRRLRIDLDLSHRRDVVRYALVTLVAAVFSTAAGIAGLLADGSITWHQSWLSAFSWYSGDAIALVGVGPFLLIHVFPWVRRQLFDFAPGGRVRSSKTLSETTVGEAIEMVAQVIAILLVLWVMFGSPLAKLGLYYLSFLPIIWIAMRQGIGRVSGGILLFNFGVVLSLRVFNADSVATVNLGTLMLAVSFTGLIVGSAVSERHRIGHELHEQTLYLHSLIENSPFGIVVLDPLRRVQLCNAAFEGLFLFSAREMSGKTLESLLSARDEIDQMRELSAQVFAGQPVHETVRHFRRDGKFLEIEINAVPLRRGGRVQGAYAIYNDVSERAKAEEEAKKHADSLKRWVEELQLRTTQMSLLNEMGDLLQCCASTVEARSVVSRLCRKLFAEAASGMLFEFRATQNVVEATAFWGDSHISESAFAPQACWAVRRGRPHWSEPASDGILCAHFASPDAVAVLCVPMMAQSEVVGVLHLQYGLGCATGTGGDQESFHKSQETLASAVAGQIALALASLRLRETLREQSIRDPLTGLFNRRIMQESLNRELHRARRKNHPVTVALVDLDHFKRFNDTWGHDAGDLVLKTMAQIFRSHFRAEDVICRYGGEEFSIILPEASAEDAAKRANVLRDEVRKLTIRYLDQNLDPVTLSIGLATFPQHGSTGEQLLRIADQCLYQSKAAGRDRVTTPHASEDVTKREASVIG